MSRERTGRIVSLKRSRKPRRLQMAMPFPDVAAFSSWTNVRVFVGAAALIWVAGARPANYADAINVRTQLNHAFLGMVLLGFSTSLPDSIELGPAARPLAQFRRNATHLTRRIGGRKWLWRLSLDQR